MRFILVCENCGERLALKDKITDKEISDTFEIVVDDEGRIHIRCNKCGNKICF